MTTAEYFVRHRSIAWVALFATLAWGVYAFRAMPQRQDPVIPVRSGVVLTEYPGASALKVEQEVTRAIERTVAENPSAETVSSLSRQGLSCVFVDLRDEVADADAVWQDLRGKLASVRNLPEVRGERLRPFLNSDFGGTVAVMLTLSSAPVGELELELRARGIRSALEAARAREDARGGRRLSGVLVFPQEIARPAVERLARGMLLELAQEGVARDGRLVEAPGSCCIDFEALAPRADVERVVAAWRERSLAGGELHPDVWPGFLVEDLGELPERLAAAARDKYTYRDLKRFADLVQDRLKRYPTIGKVEQIGNQDERITLGYSGLAVGQLGLRAQQVFAALAERNTNMPGGRLELVDQSLVVEPSGAFEDEAEIGDVVLDVTEAGYPLYLRDVAEIVRGYENPPDTMNFRTVRGEQGDLVTARAVTLAIRQVEGVQIADFGRDVDAALASLEGVLPDDLRVERTSNEPRLVEHKVAEFARNLIEAVLIVIAVALLLMEWRSAVLVAFSIPLTIAMTLGICQLLGVDLQQISIAALIIALGLLVDDPVVAADAINRELASGTPRETAAWLGPQKLARAILFATLTNIVAFLPLLLITGKLGEFIHTLPIVVCVSLVASRVVSMTFMPLLGYYLLRGQKGLEAGLEGGRSSRFARAYNGLSEWCLEHKGIVLVGCCALLVGGLVAARRIGTSFFPKDLHDTFTVNVYLPPGTPLARTRDEARRVVERIEEREGEHVASYTAFAGAGGPRFWISVVPEQRADDYAQILVHTTGRDETRAVVERLKGWLPQTSDCARITIEELESGPPVGVPVQVRLFGAELEELRALAARVKGLLYAIPGTDNVHDDWDPEVLQVSLDIDPDRASLTGITNEDVASVVQAGLSGAVPTEMREGDRVIPVVLRLRPEERSRFDDILSLDAVSSLTNARVPLPQIASIRPELTAPKIRRRDHERCLTVRCDALPGVLPSRVVEALEPQLAALDWPPGYRFEFGGEKHEQAKGFASVAIALIVSILAIYLALVLQFDSVTKPLVVYAAVPFGLVAGLMGLLWFDASFGFMAFLGVASLAGVIVSHVIVLFDYIEEMHEKGESVRRAVIDAALVRLRPVLVTVLATVGGLVPLALEGGPLWEPMCYVLIVGLIAATLVTKVVVPVLYVLFVENLRLIRWETAAEHSSGAAASVLVGMGEGS